MCKSENERLVYFKMLPSFLIIFQNLKVISAKIKLYIRAVALGKGRWSEVCEILACYEILEKPGCLPPLLSSQDKGLTAS